MEYRPKDETGLMDVGALQKRLVPLIMLLLAGVRDTAHDAAMLAACCHWLLCCTMFMGLPSGHMQLVLLLLGSAAFDLRLLCPPVITQQPDLFEARRDPGTMVPRRPEAVHVYGVDLMSTGDLLKYFADYGGSDCGCLVHCSIWAGGTQLVHGQAPPSLPCSSFTHPPRLAQPANPPPALPCAPLPAPGPKFVEWINDSSANVLFADGPTAKRAVAGMGKPLPPEDAPEQMGACGAVLCCAVLCCAVLARE